MPVAFTEQVPQKLGPTDPELLALLEASEVASRRVSHVALCGVETPICVYQTAVDAMRTGMRVTVLCDCVGARREADARACLEALARAGARILPSETLFYSLLGEAVHPFFRTFTELVKKYA
jgi:nicotinamidase-related amidase